MALHPHRWLTVGRFAAVIALAGGVIAPSLGVDRHFPFPFLLGFVLCVLASIGIVTEPSALLRTSLFTIASSAFALVLFIDDGWHLHDVAYQKLFFLTIGEAALLLIFLETRLWRLSVLPILAAGAGFTMYLLSPVAAVLATKRGSWLAFDIILLVANVGRRAIRAEDQALSRSP